MNISGRRCVNGMPGPLDVSLDELVPAVMRNTRVVVSAGPQMHDLLHAGALCAIHQVFALPQHVDRVARRHEEAIHAAQAPARKSRCHRDPGGQPAPPEFWLLERCGRRRPLRAMGILQIVDDGPSTWPVAPITSTRGLRSMILPLSCRLGRVGRKDRARFTASRMMFSHLLGCAMKAAWLDATDLTWPSSVWPITLGPVGESSGRSCRPSTRTECLSKPACLPFR